METSNPPLVSVSVLSYNHAPYIRQALDSVLAQEVDFEYEILVGDDCSSDGTQEILEEYRVRYPQKIFLTLHPRRYNCVPGRINNLTNLYNCRGKYIAMLDGDDYWIEKDKLRTQVHFLEKNPEYCLSFHDALVMTEDGSEKTHRRSEVKFPFPRNRDTYNHKDVAAGWFMPTSSLVYRNIFDREVPDWFWDVYSADYALLLLVSRHGLIRYFPELTNLRRIYSQSYSHTLGNSLEGNQMMLEELYLLAREFPEIRTSGTFNYRLAAKYHQRAALYQKAQDRYQAWRYRLKLLWRSPRLGHQLAAEKLRRSFSNKYQE